MEQYIKEIKDLEFRKEKLLEQAKKIETLLSGKYMHYYKFVEDETGNYSEEKAWEMVESFMEALRKYDVYFLLEEERWDMEDVEDFFLTEKDELFFKSFLYCVLRWGYSGIGVFSAYSGKGTFEDFLEMARAVSRNANYKKEDLFYEEKYEVTDDPFFSFNILYERVMNEPVYELTKEEKEAISDQDEEKISFDEEDEFGRIQQELYDEEKRAIKHFANKEEFAKQYLLFRELYFQMDSYLLGRMKNIIEGMLDVYLYQNNLSNFLDDELFFKTFAMLRKTAGYVQEYLPEEVK